MPNWLIVERVENNQIDREEGLARFGIPSRKASLAGEIKRGDLLITYISSGLGLLAEVRRATKSGVQLLGRGGNYDTAYPLAISTEPLIVLPRERWIPLKRLSESLRFTAGRDWRSLVRVSLRRLTDQDAAIIIDAIRSEATD